MRKGAVMLSGWTATSFRVPAATRSAPSFAPFRPHVHDVVRLGDDVQIVLNDEGCIAFGNEALNDLHQDADVFKVQTRGGFVQDVERSARIALAKLRGQFDALRLSPKASSMAAPR